MNLLSILEETVGVCQRECQAVNGRGKLRASKIYVCVCVCDGCTDRSMYSGGKGGEEGEEGEEGVSVAAYLCVSLSLSLCECVDTSVCVCVYACMHACMCI